MLAGAYTVAEEVKERAQSYPSSKRWSLRSGRVASQVSFIYLQQKSQKYLLHHDSADTRARVCTHTQERGKFYNNIYFY